MKHRAIVRSILSNTSIPLVCVSPHREKKVRVEEAEVVEYTPEEIAVRVRLFVLVNPRKCPMRNFELRYLLKSGEDPCVCMLMASLISSITVMLV